MKRLFMYAMIMASLLAVSCNNDDDENPVDKNYTAQQFIKDNLKQTEQTFNLKTADLPKTITMKGGTKITIKPGTFTKNGTPITGDFTVNVQEMLKRSDIVASGTNTNHISGEPLISDGFFHIGVTQNGASVDQILAKNMLIEIPTADATGRGTQVWEGTEDAGPGENQFAWNDLPENAIAWNDPNNDIFMPREGGWIFPEKGSVNFTFNLGKLGWFNCDIFWSTSGDKTTVYVNITGNTGKLASYQGGEGNVYVFFCGKGTNVVAQLYTPNGTSGVKSYDNSMPVGKAGKMMAFSIKEGKFYFAAKEVTITADMQIDLDLKEVTKDYIQQQIEALDNFK